MIYFENMGDFISGLFKSYGFIWGSLVYTAIWFILDFFIVKKRYGNVFISEALKEERDKLLEKNQGEKVAEMLIGNGFTLLGIIYSGIVKLFAGVTYAFALRASSLAFVDTSFTSFPIKELAYKILQTPDRNRTIVIVLALLLAWIQSMVNKSMSMRCSVDTQKLDFFTSGVFFVLCFILPVTFTLFMIVISLMELVLVLINLGPLYKKNEEKCVKSMARYKKNFDAQVKRQEEKHPEYKKSNKKKK